MSSAAEGPAAAMVAQNIPTAMVDGKRRNLQIQWLRGLAATMVMVYHTGAYEQDMLHDDRMLDYLNPGLGYFGVALFFAISGYLMSVAIRAQNPATFLAHRIIRIYPFYFLILLFFGGIRMLLGPRFSIDPATWLLMPVFAINYPVLRVEWTLIFEMSFYVSLFLIASTGFGRHLLKIAAAWLALIFVCSRIWPDPGLTLLFPLYRMLSLSTSAPLAAGLLLPRLLEMRLPGWPIFALCAVSWALGDHYSTVFEACRWFFGASAFFLLWGMLKMPESRALRLGLAGRMMARYGDYSYALYLCHVAIIQLVYERFVGGNVWEAWGIAVALALVSAVVFGQIDLALYARLKRLLKKIPLRAIRLSVLAYVAVYILAAGSGCWEYFAHDRDVPLSGQIASGIAQDGPMETSGEVAAAAVRAGYAESHDLLANIEGISRKPRESAEKIGLWALDTHRPRAKLFIAAFSRGKLVAYGVPQDVRSDVLLAYKIPLVLRRPTGLVMTVHEDSCDPGDVTVLLFTDDHRFRVFSKPAPGCP